MLTARTASDVLSLAACLELSGNSRLGFATKVTAQQPGFLFVNSQSTLGMHVSLRESHGGSRIQTWNRYAYVANNPLSNVDPLGLYKLNCDDPQNNCYTAPDFSGLFGLECGGISCDFQWFYPDWVDPSTEPNDPNRPTLHSPCKAALSTAGQNLGAVDRANANWSTLFTAGQNNGTDPSLLAAIGVRETGFQNVNEKDGAGVGVGVFQITVSPTSGVTAAQAGNLTWAANYAGNLLSSNMSYLGNKFPNFTPDQLLQATAASYNMNPYNPKNFTGNPNTIDDGTANGNYGSNVVQIMEHCF